jgi:peptidoglycan hydrolase-like protein with peptidoglycan-binding domain
VSGIVTRLLIPSGARPHTLQRLLTVSGKPVFAFVSSTPLFKTLSLDLSSGSQATNVRALQVALKARGYYKGSVKGTFGSSTKTALKKWQADQGVRKTGTITTTRFVWIPRGSILYSWSVALGSQVSGGTALATVGAPRDLVAQALISQADIANLKVGQKATLTIDGSIGDAFTGTISSIDTQPASSSSAAGSSSTVQYTVKLAPHGLPAQARSGMTGTLAIILAERQNVLIVPTRAVSGTSTTTYVRIMSDGKPVLRQVTTGMTTSTSTEITSGLTAGEVVMTGTYSSAAASTGTSTTDGSGLGGLGGFPAGGPPPGGMQGGGAVPPGGGQ